MIYRVAADGTSQIISRPPAAHVVSLAIDAEGRMLIADIGHYESEQFTISLLQEVLEQKFPTFAVLKTAVITNPVHYC